MCSVVSDCVAPWIIACQAPHSQNPLSMGFSRQEYWSGLPFPSPEDLPNPGIKPRSPTLQADALTSEPTGKPPLNLTTIQILRLTVEEHLSNSQATILPKEKCPCANTRIYPT